MANSSDASLLEQFALNGSEEAFAILVQRHIALVHSVATRHTVNPQHAEDITQAVFIILARKAGTLGRKTVIPGWLYHTARLTAANWQRAEACRINREQEAYMQSRLEEPATENLWRELSPQLDKAMAGLGTVERDALVLRYFQNKSMAEVGRLLGLAENTAQKRVSRALDKLRKFFSKRGIHSTASTIAATISANSVQVEPATLAKTITAVALAKGATASVSTLTLIKGALKVMAWNKANTVVIASVVILLTATTATVTVEKVRHHLADEAWRTADLDSQVVDSLPPEAEILPSKFSPDTMRIVGGQGGKVAGIGVAASSILSDAYEMPVQRMVLPAGLPATIQEPQHRYDFICTVPGNQKAALQQELKKQLGLMGTLATHDADVLLLEVRSPGAPNLKLSKGGPASSWSESGHYSCSGLTISNGLAADLEFYLNMPVIDATGLRDQYDIDLRWDEPYAPFRNYADWLQRNQDGLKEALQNQLGLELVPTNMPIEMLVVQKEN